MRVLLGLIVFASVSMADPIQWKAADGGNDHWYEVVRIDLSTWYEADALADARSYLGLAGHLVTITSAGESEFLANNGLDPSGAWIGAYQTPPVVEINPSADWNWTTGEAWSYTDWGAGEPNNFGGSENVAWFFFGAWNDKHIGTVSRSMVVEYESAPVPEPGTLALFGFAALGYGLYGRRRKAP